MKSFLKAPSPIWEARPVARPCAVILFLVLFTGAASTHITKQIAPHNFGDVPLSTKESPVLKGKAIVEMDADETSFVQSSGERDVWIGLLDQELIMQSSPALIRAFKKASKYIYSGGFLRHLFSSNPWLKYSIASMEQKLGLVKKLEKISTGSRLRYWNKSQSAANLLAKASLDRLFPMRKRLIGAGRQQYQKHQKILKEALVRSQAGTKALELIMASKTLPMYSWAESFFNHPFSTIQNTIIQAFEDGAGGITGLYSKEVKGSCFSFAYRVNTIMPYSAAYPGGILGDIMKGIVRSYLLVFHHTLVNFKGIFALLIGVICKSHIIQAATNALNPIFRMARRGVRAIQAFKSKTFAMRGDPVGHGLIDRMMKREAVVLISILFQLHAIEVEKQYREADDIQNALLGPSGSWAVAEGLFIGAAEFARAFYGLVRKYRESAKAYVRVCQALQPLRAEDPQRRTDTPENPNGLLDSALEFFPEAHPETSGGDPPLEYKQKQDFLKRSCKKNARFVSTYHSRELYYVQNVIQQMVRILQFYFKYFKLYISEILSIFYETALAMLETKINDSIGAAEGINSPAEDMAAAEARFAARKSASQSALEDGQLPRKLFRATRFAEESQRLASGFFEAAGAFSLYKLADAEPEDPSAAAAKQLAFRLLTASEASLRKGVGKIYQRFLNSQVLLSRVEKNQRRIKVFEFLAKCHTPLEAKSDDEKKACGKIVTSEIDESEFIAKGLFAVNLPISGSPEDIAFKSADQAGKAFAEWAEYATPKGKTRAAEIAKRNALDGPTDTFIKHMSRAALEKLTFRRFEYVEETSKIILYDETGRSLTFVGEDISDVQKLVAPPPDEEGKRVPKPDPLDCTSRFTVTDGNKGTLEFFLAAGQRAPKKKEETEKTEIPQEPQELELKPAIQLKGTIEYNDERRELIEIQNDPTAIRETIVAHFIEKRGRVAAETIAGLLMLLHSRLPIFWKRSPVEFVRHLTPKMFFDALFILSAQAYDQAEATVTLDGKLYTFPKSFSAIKDIVLSAVNRAIVRMHSLSASDAVLLIAMSSVHFAYKKIQKHRTGRTATMHLFLKEVNHLMDVLKSTPEKLKSSSYECAFLIEGEQPNEEDVLKCAVFRFMKIGSLEVSTDKQEEVRNYVTAFVKKLEEVKGNVPWHSYLNLDYFLKTAKMYGKTAARYRYEVLFDQLNDIPGDAERQSELAKLMKKLHPSLSGHRPPRPKKKEGFLAMLLKLRENFPVLPKTIRQKLSVLWRDYFSRMRRFFGSRRSWFHSWKFTPKVIQGPHFMSALKSAEVATYPDLDAPRQTFIEVADLEEFGKLLLTLETVAATLDNPSGMYNIVTQMRSTPAFTPSAREQHEKLLTRAKKLGSDVVRVAAGWVLKATAGSSGVNMALGLLALLDTSGMYMDKALQLRYLSSEALAFLDSSLDLAYILMNAPEQKPKDISLMRFNMGSFAVRAQCEPRGLGVNTTKEVQLEGAIMRIQELLEQQPLFLMEESRSPEGKCTNIIGTGPGELLGPATSISHDALLSSEAYGLCWLFLNLKSRVTKESTTITMEEVLQSVYVDSKPLSAHLEFLQQRSAAIDERKLRAKFIGPFLRYLLIATVDNLGGNLGGISFKSYDGEAKVLSFQYTLQKVSEPGPPGATLKYAADLLLSKDDDKKPRFVSFAFEGPHFLMEWYKYIRPDKLREYVDRLMGKQKEEKKIPTYAELKKLSDVYVVTDLSDLAYSLRQSSKLDVAKVARAAALELMENTDSDDSALKSYGLSHMLVDLVSQAELVKKDCIGKALEDYDNFRSSTLLERELFRYDCFYSQITESSAFADAARSVGEEDVRAVMNAIDKAYEKEAQELYEKLLDSSIPHSTLANVVFQAAEQFAISDMVKRLLPKFLSWVRKNKKWEEIAPKLKQQGRSTGWTASRKTSMLGRPVTYLEHPRLLNPYQVIIDVMLAATTGSARRRRFPVLKPLKRLKALYAMIKPGRKSRRDLRADLNERRIMAEHALAAYREGFPEAMQ